MSYNSLKAHIEAKLARKETKEKKHKYKAEKVEGHGGYSFGSKLEAAVYNMLYLLQRAGVIKVIQVQDTVLLSDANIIYKPDFKITKPDGSFYWVEAKGFKTPVWAIKKRLWAVYGPGLLEIYEGNHKSPQLIETIKPRNGG